MQKLKLFFMPSIILLSGCLEQAKTSTAESSATPLPINHPAPTSDTVSAKAVEDTSVLGTRFYVRSVFEEAFQNASNKSTLQQILDKYLGGLDDKGLSGNASFENLSIFGGTCDIYSAAGAGAGCNYSRSNIFNAAYSTPTPSREAVRVKICTEVTNTDSFISAGLAKINLTTSSPYNEANFQLLFEQFYPGLSPSPDVLASFQNLWNSMSQGNESALDKWRMIYFVVCRTPEWQLL